jgi:hypothetical protein
MATKLEGELPPAIEGLFADLQIQPSFLCRILFQWAAVLSMRKQEGINELSCTGVFLAATILPEEIFAPLLASNDRAWEAEAFLTFMDALSKDAEIKIDKIVDGYYSKSIADISIESIDISNVHHTSTLKQALVGWLRRTKANDAVRTVGALDLIRAALENADAILQMRLRDVGLNSITIIDLIPSLGDFEPTREQKRGRRVVKKRNVKRDSRRTQGATQTESFTRDLRSRIDRDPDDPTQYALGIKVYTAALATILRTARGEFCFGLFGPWGIGKTRLVRHMTPLLESPDQYKAATAERGYAVGSDGDDKLKYEVVWYSAWKFRRPPEAWIFLYENMATHAMAAGLWRKIGRIIRVGVAKHGFWPLVFGLLALALQLHFALGSESIGPHDSGGMDGRSID